LRNVLPWTGASLVGAVEVSVVPVDCCPCCVCWLSSAVELFVTCEELSSYVSSGTGIDGKFSRSSGMSGGAMGG
jgi:hypothetical protein